MWNCKKCGEKHQDEFDICWNCGTGKDGNINKDFKVELDENEIEELAEIEDISLSSSDKEEKINSILVTTTQILQNRRIVKYFNMLTEESMIGTGILSEFSASINDIIGGQGAYSSKFKTIKEDVLKLIKYKTYKLGANAIVGTEVEYLITQNNMIMFSISGTPVIAEDIIHEKLDVLNEIEKLFNLKQKEVLTEEEYIEKKKILLNKIN
ncbi:heavy metal-binding domain-containing protein [Clostridium sp. D2Q-11]|uniref:Heavy metal-binding domain-containing protein n=1 Tax=Anaeromonas frigoriresistens TaxID=2683708 RepID=A0A942UV47_9FIRM|nr:heavy metal-binding domain-containing protein [Anaeromonas frigoriresistens]MBS4539658.1 heavy metal-binding domain-containing protein [Anaeromonas frigoriresistens]